MGFFQNLLKDAAGGFFGSDYLRDYTHAAKTFGSNLYQYSPKFKFLFHVYFNINDEIYDIDGSKKTQQNFGLLVRDIKLPSFTIQTTKLNQYNRKRIVQTKITYDPITINFFDDNSNTMAKLWASYYTYYYYDGSIPDVSIFKGRGSKGQDLSSVLKGGQVRGLGGRAGSSDPNSAKYYERDIYNEFVTGQSKWGYIGGEEGTKKQPFFKDITVFGFYQKNFIAYTLVNPVITQFAHDTYNYEEGTGVMKNQMTIDYETVVYNEGQMAGASPSGGGLVPGFADNNTYDRRTSPIAMPGSNNTVLGQGGLVDGLTGAFNSLKGGNPLSAIKTAGAVAKTFKNTNILQTLKKDLKNSFMKNLQSQPNQTRNLNFDTPAPPQQTNSPPTGAVTQNSTTPQTNPFKAPTVNASGAPTAGQQVGNPGR